LEVSDRVVVMNHGQIEQIGAPQQVWEEPASSFVYGFLGDVNQFKGHVQSGQMRIGSKKQNVFLPAPEHTQVEASQALAYVRPYDFDVHRYSPEDEGIVAQLQRAVVVGPIARMELLREETEDINDLQLIDAQIPASLFHQQGFKVGEKLVLSPRKARVFMNDQIS
jgi:sulfate transport system ATP-binding protein